jgi:hypothetical protein
MLRVGVLLASGVLGASVPSGVDAFLRSDRGAQRAADQIMRRLPLGESVEFGIARRALFRMQMRGGGLKGLGYLLRLSLSPTEEDWEKGAEERRSWIADALTRPFRLARKYGRSENSQ